MADDAEALPTLDASELAFFETLGTRRSIAPGEYGYREGDATYDFCVIISGTAEGSAAVGAVHEYLSFAN